MDEVELANYVAGIHKGPLRVGPVGDEIARALGVRFRTSAWLSDYTLTKTRFRHKEIDFRDYQKLPAIISDGFVAPGNKHYSVEIQYVEEIDGQYRFWRISLKSTSIGEVFVNMLHRGKQKDFKRIYRRTNKQGTLIRHHKGQLARRIARIAPEGHEGGAP